MIFQAFVVALLAAAAPTMDSAGVVEKLQAWLDGTTTLEMSFQQSLVSGALGTTTTERGRLYLERPGKLRWDYLDPERKIALLLGDRTELYLADDRQLTRGHLGPDQSLFPRVLAGKERLKDLFVARLVATPDAGGDGRYKLRLSARDAAAGLAEITLTLKPPACSIDAADLLDDTGNRTSYRFGDLRRNRALPVGIFAFEPPPGTDIIEDR